MSAPRLVTRALITSFLTVALVLGVVFGLLSLRVSEQVRGSVASNLALAQQVIRLVEARRQQDMRAAVATLAENPTLKAALETWLTERDGASQRTSRQLLATLQRETDKIADLMAADVLAVAEENGRIVASSGRLASAWRRGDRVAARAPKAVSDRTQAAGNGMFHIISVPLQLAEDTIGSLELGTALDADYARRLADLSRGHAAIVSNNVVLASTLPEAASSDLTRFEDG